MATDDIYGNKAKYEQFKTKIDRLHIPLKPDPHRRGRGISKYWVQNSDNRAYFFKMCQHFEAKDLSYVRRVRLLQTLKAITHHTDKNLKDCIRDDINAIVGKLNEQYKSSHSKADLICDLKLMWKLFFPEADDKGRPDDTIVPYPVRHLSSKIDVSRQKNREDRLSWEEYERIITYFVKDSRMQAYLAVQLESLARPQELLYRKIKDIELFQNYAKMHLSDHGKEGTGILQVIDSFPLLVRWLNEHPDRHNKHAYIFCNRTNAQQMTPYMVNKLLRQACKHLSIEKPVTGYSLKRNGVTYRRLRGDSDADIQHAARWRSTKQLKTYDMSNQEDVFKKELAKRGLIPAEQASDYAVAMMPKTCLFCESVNAYDRVACENCKRPLDRKKLREQAQEENKQFDVLKGELAKIREEMTARQSEDDKLLMFFRQPEIQELYKAMLRSVKKRTA